MKNSLHNRARQIARAIAPFLAILMAIGAQGQQAAPKTDSVTEARLLALEKHVALHKPGQSHLLVVGLTTFGYTSFNTVTTTAGVNTTTKSSVMGNSDTYEFSPMFLIRQGKKVLLEFEPSFNHDGVGVNWAAISYFARPNLIIRGGYFVLPFGIYTKKLAAGWINKVATDPIGLPTGQDYGVEVSGGLPLGSMKWNYDLSVTNGLNLMPDGTLSSVNLGANSRTKTFTGRLGLLPLHDNSLELGVSAMTGGVANGQAQFSNGRADLYALDLNYVKNVDPFQINIKGQYNTVNVGSQNYVNPVDTTKRYTFNNQSKAGYGQFSIRPIESQSAFVKNLEFAIRYGMYNTPANSTWGANTTQLDYGVNYWINWRTVLRVTYEVVDSKSTAAIVSGPSEIKTGALHIQFSIQL